MAAWTCAILRLFFLFLILDIDHSRQLQPIAKNGPILLSVTNQSRVFFLSKMATCKWTKHGQTCLLIPGHDPPRDITVYMDIAVNPGPGKGNCVVDHEINSQKKNSDRRCYQRRDLLNIGLGLQANSAYKKTMHAMSDETLQLLQQLGIQRRYRGRRAGTNIHRRIPTQITNRPGYSTNNIKVQSKRRRILSSLPRPVHSSESHQMSVPSVLLTNAHSLVNKIDEAAVILTQNNIDICIVSETWHHSDLPVQALNIDNYHLFLKSRQHQRGGGVALYIRKHIHAKVLTDITVPEELECLWVLLRPDRLPRGVSSLAVCAVYNPPNSPYQDLLVDHLIDSADTLRISYPDVGFIIAGDFNRIKVDRVMSGNDFKQIIKFPTRGQATLDLIFTNIERYFKDPVCLPPFGNSDHNCIILNPCIKQVPNKIKVRSIRPLKDSGIRGFGTWIQSQEVYNSVECQAKTNAFYCLMNEAVEIHFPKVNKKMCTSDRPWMTPKIKKMINARQREFGLGNSRNWRVLRNRVKREISSAKINYYADRVRHLQKLDSKKWHQQVKVMTKRERTNFSIQVPGVCEDNHIHIANVINDKFVHVSSNITPLDIANLPDFLPTSHPAPHLFPWEVYNVMRKIKTNKASGPDGIPSRLLKEFAYELSVPLTHIFNSSYNEGVVPSQWKKAIVIPVPKEYPANIERLRPVSLTDGMAKIAEQFIVNWILDDIRHKIDINQYGNVKGVSTSHYLVSLMHFLHRGADSPNNRGTVVLTDFSKAFDLIDHTLLINKFLKLGVRESIIPWICSFISGRQQCVKYNQTLSDFKTLRGGLPQGTRMGPIGFQCFINDFTPDNNVGIWKYVDDLTLAENCLSSVTGDLQIELDRFVKWTKNNKLCLNPSKCQALQICFKRNPPIPALTIDHNPLPFVSFAKILGIKIQNDLKWDHQVSDMMKKTNSRLYMLRTLKKFGFTTDELIAVYKGYVRPMMEYADVVWNSSITKDQMHTLEKLQKRACKIILGSNNYNSYQEAIEACGIETLADRRQAHCCKFAESLFKCKQTENLIPPLRKNVHGRELRNSHHVSLPACRTNRFKNSPIPFYINLLNS